MPQCHNGCCLSLFSWHQTWSWRQYICYCGWNWQRLALSPNQTNSSPSFLGQTTQGRPGERWIGHQKLLSCQCYTGQKDPNNDNGASLVSFIKWSLQWFACQYIHHKRCQVISNCTCDALPNGLMVQSTMKPSTTQSEKTSTQPGHLWPLWSQCLLVPRHHTEEHNQAEKWRSTGKCGNRLSTTPPLVGVYIISWDTWSWVGG